MNCSAPTPPRYARKTACVRCETAGLRWYRCLRCDSWVALSPPARPARQYPPRREEITLPLRDRYVLRLIAVDRLAHFLVLSADWFAPASLEAVMSANCL
jgi:hypothetical protein